MRRNRGHAEGTKRLRRASILLTLTAFLLLSLAGASYAGYRYDREGADRLLPGVHIAGVDVGDMTRAEAEQALAGSVSAILDRPIDVRAGSHLWHETAKSLGTRVDVEGAVDQAFGLSDSFNWPARVYHRLLNRPISRSLQLSVSYDRPAVSSFVKIAARQVVKEAHDASIDFTGGRLVVEHSQAGVALPAKAAIAVVRHAVEGTTGSVRLGLRRIPPAVVEDSLGMTIVVRTSMERLYLYDGVSLVKAYSVATGQPQYPTPLGHFEIINKRINPTWVNPATDTWGKNEPAQIPPGPDNPLGTRALDLSAPGIRIHGTPDDTSIGHAASHGCIRMHIPDSEDLFGRVGVGTRVIIVL